MEQVQNEPTPKAGRVGILERLKSQNSLEGIVELCAEFETYKHASAKTTRRFGRIIKSLLKVQDDVTRKEWKEKLLATGYGGAQ